MFDVKTIKNGFVFLSAEYIFDSALEIVSESQCHASTNQGTILLDLSCTINGTQFTDINNFIEALKGE